MTVVTFVCFWKVCEAGFLVAEQLPSPSGQEVNRKGVRDDLPPQSNLLKNGIGNLQSWLNVKSA